MQAAARPGPSGARTDGLSRGSGQHRKTNDVVIISQSFGKKRVSLLREQRELFSSIGSPKKPPLIKKRIWRKSSNDAAKKRRAGFSGLSLQILA
ncbi:hypothetical protein [Paenibacillus tyrfis]|uniref:hypothetical protein n=1 Tax=Paenibacillus tyrfis TaxID=1501230 RepID=UPI0020A0FCCB|nr:hypothetical protein [Paenibacillus tyrfis]MCP1307231.1 hypothetical protein [Paenibacillus tyrfis]